MTDERDPQRHVLPPEYVRYDAIHGVWVAGDQQGPHVTASTEAEARAAFARARAQEEGRR